jgi:transposase-like protein
MSATYTISREFSPTLGRAIVNAYREGYKIQDISTLFNIKYNQIYRFLVTHKHKTPVRKGKINEDK